MFFSLFYCCSGLWFCGLIVGCGFVVGVCLLFCVRFSCFVVSLRVVVFVCWFCLDAFVWFCCRPLRICPDCVLLLRGSLGD